jgi:hypothetical protein
LRSLLSRIIASRKITIWLTRISLLSKLMYVYMHGLLYRKPLRHCKILLFKKLSVFLD